jgi:phosphoribosyl 1,2-cyclic phosphate phosphodiesterase
MKSHFKVTFLGTGTSQGIPVIGSKHPVCLSDDLKDKRLRVSVLLEIKDKTYVIDCGPDFRQQMLQHQVEKLDAILITHEHSDHTAGLDDIRPYYFRQGAISFYTTIEVFAALKKRFGYIFETHNKYPGAPTISQHVVSKKQPFLLDDTLVTPVEALHNTLPVLGYSMEGFTYLTDVKTMAPDEIEKIKGTKVLVINALRQEPHPSHLNLEEALAFIDKVKPHKAYLTHISHHLGFHQRVQETLPENVFLAYDGLTIEL